MTKQLTDKDLLIKKAEDEKKNTEGMYFAFIIHLESTKKNINLIIEEKDALERERLKLEGN